MVGGDGGPTMSSFEPILKEIMGMCPSLRVEKSAFGTTAELDFFDDEDTQKHVILRLSGIHVWIARQTMMGSEVVSDGGIGNDLEELDVSEDSGFLKTVLKEKLPLPTHMLLYDTGGVRNGERGFRRPCHVSISCSAGVLDVVCERIEKVESFGAG